MGKELLKNIKEFEELDRIEKELKDFDKMMELVKQYPIKKHANLPPNKPYQPRTIMSLY